MSTQILDRANSLSSGADLWLIPDLYESDWSCQIDWYLGFSILRSLSRKPQSPSENLQEIVSACELEMPSYKVADNAPIMIDGSGKLPVRWIVTVPCTPRIETWINRSYHIWNQLGRPSVRIFIANSYSTDKMAKNWGQLALNQNVGLVPSRPNS